MKILEAIRSGSSQKYKTGSEASFIAIDYCCKRKKRDIYY
jgi:hypothetical protein